MKPSPVDGRSTFEPRLRSVAQFYVATQMAELPVDIHRAVFILAIRESNSVIARMITRRIASRLAHLLDVHPGRDRFPLSHDIEAIGLYGLAQELGAIG